MSGVPEGFSLWAETAASGAGVLVCRWIASWVYSDIIGEIASGTILGPTLLQWIPYPEAWTWLGSCGLLLLIAEAGLQFEMKTIEKAGWRVTAAATVGVILPLILCPPFLLFFGATPLEAVAGSACLSSTSIGFAVTLLRQHGMTGSPLGQMISGAAMLDDVESLVLLGILSSWSQDGNGGMLIEIIVIPILTSLLVLIVGLLLCISLPQVSEWYLDLECKLLRRWRPLISRQQQISPSLLLLFIGLSITFFVLLSILARTTHLLGAFVGGLAMSRVPGAQEAYDQISPFISLGMSFFFVSIGFLIPLTQLFEWRVCALGLLFSLPAIVSKLLIGLFEPSWPSLAVLGWAMVGRGEVGFMMVSSAYQGGLLSDDIFLIVVWSLIISTALSPFPFQYFVKKLKTETSSPEEVNELELS